MAQPHKGDRRQVLTRLPFDHWLEVKERATALGLPVSEYVALAVRQHLETTDPPAGAGELISRKEVAALYRSA